MNTESNTIVHRLRELGLDGIEDIVLYITQDISDESMETIINKHFVNHMVMIIGNQLKEDGLQFTSEVMSNLSDDFTAACVARWMDDVGREDADSGMVTFEEGRRVMLEYHDKQLRYRAVIKDALGRKRNLQ